VDSTSFVDPTSLVGILVVAKGHNEGQKRTKSVGDSCFTSTGMIQYRGVSRQKRESYGFVANSMGWLM
jgi:hypothetical protein